MADFDEEYEAEMSVRLACPPERVWAALTVADEPAAWYRPAELAPQAFSEPVVGGRFRVGSTVSQAGFSGEYLVLDMPCRIEQTWRWDGEARESRVRIGLVADGDSTEVRVVHGRLDAATAEACRQGWVSCLSRLPAHLARG
ncbi:SRPBCC family protein [Actinoplanes sp. NPDC049802]|uniref:SRPBCC family protein n=1 Tax=Actinoplanes sp. NPDC049802 TaxID=3154742 RepID=UPI0033DF91EC